MLTRWRHAALKRPVPALEVESGTLPPHRLRLLTLDPIACSPGIIIWLFIRLRKMDVMLALEKA